MTPDVGPVLVVGTGLIGTSLALGLRRADVHVLLHDTDEAHLTAAVARGAGERHDGSVVPAVVVVAVPPAATADAVVAALTSYESATVVDVAGVKGPVVDAVVARAGTAAERYVPTHPMSGRELTGPDGAVAELVRDRVWVLTPHGAVAPEHLVRARALADALGAVVRETTPQDHDAAVARVSHLPQLVASALAASLAEAPAATLDLAGPGLRDTTRIAASSADLWVEVLRDNAGEVAACLDGVVADLTAARDALSGLARRSAASRPLDPEVGLESGSWPSASGTRVESRAQDPASTDPELEPVRDLLDRGNVGRSRIPGRHGGADPGFVVVPVQLQDKPGELARLFVAAGAAGVNVEDVRMEHALGRPTGRVDLAIDPSVSGRFVEALRHGGFDVRA